MLRIGIFTGLVAILAGCQASQSPAVIPSKDVIVEIHAGGDVRVEIHYSQSTDVELGGGNVSSPKQDHRLEIPIGPFP